VLGFAFALLIRWDHIVILYFQFYYSSSPVYENHAELKYL